MNNIIKDNNIIGGACGWTVIVTDNKDSYMPIEADFAEVEENNKLVNEFLNSSLSCCTPKSNTFFYSLQDFSDFGICKGFF